MVRRKAVDLALNEISDSPGSCSTAARRRSARNLETRSREPRPALLSILGPVCAVQSYLGTETGHRAARSTSHAEDFQRIAALTTRLFMTMVSSRRAQDADSCWSAVAHSKTLRDHSQSRGKTGMFRLAGVPWRQVERLMGRLGSGSTPSSATFRPPENRCLASMRSATPQYIYKTAVARRSPIRGALHQNQWPSIDVTPDPSRNAAAV